MITICHHSAGLVMPIGDPPDRFFYPNLTLMIDSYCLLQILGGTCFYYIPLAGFWKAV